MRLLRTLLVSGSAVAAAAALAITSGSTATIAAAPGRAVHATSPAPSARFLASARVALVSYLRHNHPQAWFAHPGSDHAGPKSTSKDFSFNWSGYADTSKTKAKFTKVSGSWTTPSVRCTAEDTITSEWVGIDGALSSDPTVEQDGTLDWCFEGTPTYFTWYEMFPHNTVEVGKSLQPGDKVSATVSRSGTQYTLSLTDSTHKADSFKVKSSKTVCKITTCKAESVEWIAERPEFSIGIAPLADYSSWTLTAASQTSLNSKGKAQTGTISSYSPNESVGMIDGTSTYILSSVSGLSGGGKIFSTTWENSY